MDIGKGILSIEKKNVFIKKIIYIEFQSKDEFGLDRIVKKG